MGGVALEDEVVTVRVLRQRRFNAFLSLKLYLTCNHIHLLIKDTGNNIIAESMQLVPTRVPGADKRSRSLFG
jgi:hypothetical protein